MKPTSKLLILSFICLAGCKSGDKMPDALKSVQDAKSLLPGKTWVVKDVGLKSFSVSSETNPDAAISVDWFSAAKELGEYERQSKENFKNASIELKQDTVAVTSGLKITGAQTYVITDEAKDDTPPGIRLELNGGTDEFKDMGITTATFTYFVLAANEKQLLLQTPNEVNSRKVILLLEAK
jgi:hypothetical protein